MILWWVLSPVSRRIRLISWMIVLLGIYKELVRKRLNYLTEGMMRNNRKMWMMSKRRIKDSLNNMRMKRKVQFRSYKKIDNNKNKPNNNSNSNLTCWNRAATPYYSPKRNHKTGSQHKTTKNPSNPKWNNLLPNANPNNSNNTKPAPSKSSKPNTND